MTYAPITVAARRVLLDALEALEPHRDGLVLVGSQAIYMYTGGSDIAVATTTKDSDIALIPVRLVPTPTLEAAMVEHEFSREGRQGSCLPTVQLSRVPQRAGPRGGRRRGWCRG